jgi:hypothetical protein
VFYAPGLLLPITRLYSQAHDALFRCRRLWLAFLAGLILVYAKWWAWYGGVFWGPRFFLFASFPACLAVAIGLSAKPRSTLPALLALFIVLTLSSWVAIEGVMFDLSGLDLCHADLNYESLCWYVPEFSPLWRPFVDFRPPTIDRVAVAAYFAVVYAWLAAPLAADILRRSRIVAAEFVSTRRRLESWRI